MKPYFIRIGNSRNIRLPKSLIEEAGLVEIRVERGAIFIQRADSLRAGWAKAAKEMRAQGDDALLDPPVLTQFDEKEWDW